MILITRPNSKGINLYFIIIIHAERIDFIQIIKTNLVAYLHECMRNNTSPYLFTLHYLKPYKTLYNNDSPKLLIAILPYVLRPVGAATFSTERRRP